MEKKKPIKKWIEIPVPGARPSYSLSKEFNPIWFAKVYVHDGRYCFTLGKRVVQGEPTPPRYSNKGRGYKNASTAKSQAMYWVRENHMLQQLKSK